MTRTIQLVCSIKTQNVIHEHSTTCYGGLSECPRMVPSVGLPDVSLSLILWSLTMTHATVTNYSEAETFLEGGRDPSWRKISHNTVVHRKSHGSIAILYHSTDVITYHMDGRIVFRTGGWYSLTTKVRLNEFSPCRVWSDKGTWEIDLYLGNGRAGDSALFEDGVTLGADRTFQDWKASRWARLHPKPSEGPTFLAGYYGLRN